MNAQTRIILAMALFFMALIGVVIAVGLYQQTLDPTGTVLMLGGVFTSLMGGIFLKNKDHDRHG